MIGKNTLFPKFYYRHKPLYKTVYYILHTSLIVCNSNISYSKTCVPSTSGYKGHVLPEHDHSHPKAHIQPAYEPCSHLARRLSSVQYRALSTLKPTILLPTTLQISIKK